MPLVSGTKLGPYEVLGPLGAGGMGEVYRARDTRLDRSVAIKILPGQFSEDPVRKQRFEREAKTISSLNHPHICVLYDVGHQDGTDYLVMECVEGATLAKRLEKGPLPLEQVLKFGAQIADALDKAHRSGVVHRDLKPGNIMLTKSGVKLLDFGLAKATGQQGATDLSTSPTVSEPLTAEGSIVGTFQYIAPEQLEHQQTDARTDIFSFGLILYEMATGKRAFEGRTQASLIAAILKEEPRPLVELAPLTPPALDRLVRTCLAKDPDARWQSARDLEIHLNWLEEGGEADAATQRLLSKLRVRERIAWGAALLLLAIAALLGVGQFRAPVTPAQPVRSSLMPPSGSSFLPDNFAISPDGTRLAFVAVGSGGRNSLWVRALSASGAQQVNNTEDALLPFWAPDSQRIGFFAAGKLKMADMATGALREICDAPVGRAGGTWGRDDTIVFSPFVVGPLLRVPAKGGVPVPVTRISRQGSGQAHRWPYFLPDSKHFLYFVDWSSPGDPQGNGIYVGSIDSTDSKRISAEITGNVVFEAGHLLWVQDRRLMAQPFDLNRLEPTGPAAPVGEQELEKDLAFSHAGFSISDNGVLVFQSATDTPSRLIWFDASGKELSQLPATHFRDPSISPDGRFLAVSSDDYGNGRRFIRVYDLIRGVSTRLTEGGSEENPLWTRDGKQITYVSRASDSYSLMQVPADASRKPQVLIQGAKMLPNDWTPDGRLVYMSFDKGAPVLTAYSGADRPSMTIGPGAEARFSPDGKWIAFNAASETVMEVFIQPFPGPGARIQVSSAGGAQPCWSRDGKKIFYIAPDKKLMAVSFDSQTQSTSAPRALFQTRIISPVYVLFQYDVAPDGSFLINSFPFDYSSPLVLLTGWTAQLKH